MVEHVHHPRILWTQRLSEVWLTVQLPCATNVTMKIEREDETHTVKFSANILDTAYAFKLKLFDKISSGAHNVKGLNIDVVLRKAKNEW